MLNGREATSSESTCKACDLQNDCRFHQGWARDVKARNHDRESETLTPPETEKLKCYDPEHWSVTIWHHCAWKGYNCKVLTNQHTSMHSVNTGLVPRWLGSRPTMFNTSTILSQSALGKGELGSCSPGFTPRMYDECVQCPVTGRSLSIFAAAFLYKLTCNVYTPINEWRYSRLSFVGWCACIVHTCIKEGVSEMDSTEGCQFCRLYIVAYCYSIIAATELRDRLNSEPMVARCSRPIEQASAVAETNFLRQCQD